MCYVLSLISSKKVRLSNHRKNEFRKKRTTQAAGSGISEKDEVKQVEKVEAMTVSINKDVFLTSKVSGFNHLRQRISQALAIPPGIIIYY